MNAKKSVLLLASVAMLASCGGAGMSRADAIKKMGDIYTASTAKDFKDPTKVTITNDVKGVTNTHIYDNEAKSYYAKYLGEAKITVGEEEMSIGANTQFWAYQDGENIVVAGEGGDVGSKYYKFSKLIGSAAIAGGEAKYAAAVTGAKSNANPNNPYGIPAYLGKFLESGSVDAGATKANMYLKSGSESYTSKGEGHLDAKFTAVYVGQTPEDEPLEYVWEGNLQTKVYNGKKGSTDEWKWGKADIAKPDLSKYEEMDLASATVMLALIAASL
ncbi:MAG: hypothetical protein HUJ60_05150 [Bacilli bacterium]|nr:hypothetical protein [Bacilli bacterium]